MQAVIRTNPGRLTVLMPGIGGGGSGYSGFMLAPSTNHTVVDFSCAMRYCCSNFVKKRTFHPKIAMLSRVMQCNAMT